MFLSQRTDVSFHILAGVSPDLQTAARIRKVRGDLTQAIFAHRLGVSRGAVGNWERGLGIKRENLLSIAREFSVSFDWLATGNEASSGLGPAHAATGDVTYAGIVQAGLFRPVDEYFNQDEDWQRPEGLSRHPKYPRVRQYAWQAKGNSMDQAGIYDGQWIVGADAADYIDQYGDIESGDLVVVQRLRFGGSERELTVKEIRYYRDRYELHPRSSDPSFKPIIVRKDLSADDEEVTVVGVVLSAFTDLRRRRR